MYCFACDVMLTDPHKIVTYWLMSVVTRDEKKAFIRCKYEKRRYAIITCANLEDRRQDLKQAILSRDIYALLQVYAEGIDFMDPLPDMVVI